LGGDGSVGDRQCLRTPALTRVDERGPIGQGKRNRGGGWRYQHTEKGNRAYGVTTAKQWQAVPFWRCGRPLAPKPDGGENGPDRTEGAEGINSCAGQLVGIGPPRRSRGSGNGRANTVTGEGGANKKKHSWTVWKGTGESRKNPATTKAPSRILGGRGFCVHGAILSRCTGFCETRGHTSGNIWVEGFLEHSFVGLGPGRRG